ncbi:MAG: hypothetical protein NXI20_03265 [bacterium]|nr:hypothetical protein [bacterium]
MARFELKQQGVFEMKEQGIQKFFEDKVENKSGRNRTINIPDSTHSFYKMVASNFDVKLNALITNILDNWKDLHEDEVKTELIKRISKR